MDFFNLFLTENKGCVVTNIPRPKNLIQAVPLDKEKAKIGKRKILSETAQWCLFITLCSFTNIILLPHRTFFDHLILD